MKPTKADINSAAQHVEKKYKVQTKYNNGRKVWLMPPKLKPIHSRSNFLGLIWNVNILATEYLQNDYFKI